MIKLLQEGNFANSGNFKVTIEKGEFEETLRSMDSILDHIMDEIDGSIRSNNKEVIMTYFKTVFKNWLKNDAPGYEQVSRNWPSNELFYQALLPKTIDIIKGLEMESQSLSPDSHMTEEEIVSHFPPFVQKNVHDTTLFFGGRRLRFKKIGGLNITGVIADYIDAVINKEDAIETLRISFSLPIKITVPDMIIRAYKYHAKRNNKLSPNEVPDYYKRGAKEGRDYTLLDKIDHYEFRLVTSKAYLDAEGQCVQHCVGGYWPHVRDGVQSIISVVDTRPDSVCPTRDPDLNANKEHITVYGPHSVCTIALDGRYDANNPKNVLQMKGLRNGPVIAEAHDAIWTFLLKHKFNPTNDKNCIGTQPSQKVKSLFDKNKTP